MRIRLPRTIVFAVAAALAVGNGFAPRHAQAVQHATVTAGHAHHHGAAQAGHHHDAGAVEQAAAKALCHNDGAASKQPNSPLHNCCVASCSAVAFVSTDVSFDTPIPSVVYGVFPPVQLTPAALTSDDPPPR